MPAPSASDPVSDKATAPLPRRLGWGAFRLLFRAAMALPEPVLARLAGPPPQGCNPPADPRARVHARLVRRFGPGPAASADDARRPCLFSLSLLDGRPLAMRDCRDFFIPGPGGDLQARHYVPHDCPSPSSALIFFHFGGCVVGDLETCHAACTILAHHARCEVISVAYRLAPEHKFPAALEDALAAWKWVQAEAGRLGIAPDHVAIGGDSAGGYLSAATSLVLRERGARLPRVQLLMYPVLEMDRSALPPTPFDNCYPLSRADMAWFADQYMARPEDAKDPLCSVARATQLAGLPPALLIQARHDVLFDEGAQFARRLRAEGVPVARRIHKTLPHAFSAMTGGIPAARAAMIETAQLLGQALRAPDPTASPIFKEDPDD